MMKNTTPEIIPDGTLLLGATNAPGEAQGPGRWLSTKEAASYFGISRQAMLKRIKTGAFMLREITGRGAGGKQIEIFVASSDNIHGDKRHSSDNLLPGDSQSSDNQNCSSMVSSDNAKNDPEQHPEQHPDFIRAELLKNNDVIGDCSDNGQSSDNINGKKGHFSDNLLPGDSQSSDNHTGHATPVSVANNAEPGSELTRNTCRLPACAGEEIDLSPEWIGLTEAAGYLGITRQALDNRARRNNWELARVSLPGSGVKLYCRAEVLPQDKREDWRTQQLSRSGTNLPAVIANEQSGWAALTTADRDKALAKHKIVIMYRETVLAAKMRGIAITAADKSFEAAAAIELGEQLDKLGLGTVSVKAVRKWDAILRKAGNLEYPLALAGARRGKSGRPQYDCADLVKARVDMWIKKNPYYTATAIMAKLFGEFADLPYSYRTVADLVQEAKKDKYGNALVRGAESESYKNMRPRMHRVRDLIAGQRWELDGKMMNNFVYSPFYAHEKQSMRMVIRPWVITIRDVPTGYVLAVVPCVAESFHAIKNAVAKAILHGGIPSQIVADHSGANDNIYTDPINWARYKTVAGMKARELLACGYKGIYGEFGIEPHFTRRANPMSKNIEPAHRDIYEKFETEISIYTGRKGEEREELFKLTNMQLIQRYGHLIASWEDYFAAMANHIENYNNTPSPKNERLDGTYQSPKEAYFAVNHPRASVAEIEAKILYRWPNTATVRQGEIKVNNRFYRHPDFGLLNGQQIYVYYDEVNLDRVLIGTALGQINKTPATAVLPSCYNNKEQYIAAMKQVARDEKAQARRYVTAKYANNPALDADYEVITQLEEYGFDSRFALATVADTMAEQEHEQDGYKAARHVVDPLEAALENGIKQMHNDQVDIPAEQKTTTLNVTNDEDEDPELFAALDKAINHKRIGVGA